MRLAVVVVRSNRLRSQEDGRRWLTSVNREQALEGREETLRRGYIDMDVESIDTSDEAPTIEGIRGQSSLMGD